MGVSNGDGDGGGVDGDGSGGNSPSRQGARTETSVPRMSSATATVLRNFSWISARFLGFSRDGEYMAGRARSVAAQGAHTTPRRGPRAGCAQVWCGHPVAPLRLLFGLRLRYVILGTLAFIRFRSENIFCVTFLKPKIAENRNWHCGILSIG